jgi:dihydroneopterin triphosphate diphosphatase
VKAFCISAYLICQSQYLLLKRCSPYLNGTWQMISGKIEEGETAHAAALREIQEETGITPDSFYCADAVETFYMKTRDEIVFCPVFVGMIREKADVRLSPHEHDAFAWLPFEEARKRLIFAEQKRVIAHIHENFVLNEPHHLHLIV